MPDITLYKTDVEELHRICTYHYNMLRMKGVCRILTEEEYDYLRKCQELADKLGTRLAQNLHP